LTKNVLAREKNVSAKLNPRFHWDNPIVIRRFWQEIDQINALDLKHKPKPKI